MNKKKGIIIGVVSLGILLVGVLLFFIFRKESVDYKDLGKITYIQYSIEEESFELIKEEECWYWKDKKDLLLDETYIEEQARVARKELRITKTEDKGSWEKYGLDDVMFSLVLKDSKGRKIEIQRGDAISEDLYFVRIGNKRDIYTASSKIMDVIDSLAAMRTKSEQMEFVGE